MVYLAHMVHFLHLTPLVNGVSASFHSLWNEKKAVTAMEYGLIAALVAVTIITSLTTVGTKLQATFTTIAAKI